MFKDKVSFIIILFVGVFSAGILAYYISTTFGEETIENFSKIVELEIHDTVADIDVLQSRDYAYMHTGRVYTIELKNHRDFEIALYIIPQQLEDSIKIGDAIIKGANSKTINIISESNAFSFELKNIVRYRNNSTLVLISIFSLFALIAIYATFKNPFKKKKD